MYLYVFIVFQVEAVSAPPSKIKKMPSLPELWKFWDWGWNSFAFRMKPGALDAMPWRLSEMGMLMPYLLDWFFIAWFDSILSKTSLFFLLYILGSWLQSHLLVEVASWLAPATKNTVLLKSCDLIFVLNHTWLPFYQRASSLFPWLTYSSIVDLFLV